MPRYYVAYYMMLRVILPTLIAAVAMLFRAMQESDIDDDMIDVD